MFNNEEFDAWVYEYDDMTKRSELADAYPFAGYSKVLDHIYKEIMKKEKTTVLDLGFGTAVLTSRLYDQGCEIYGQDYSTGMLKIASGKMPKAHLYQGDFSAGLVQELLEHKYDFIIATYSLHHLDDEQKVVFIDKLFDLLKEDGKILIGDISFATRSEMDKCKAEAKDEWDDEETYFVIEEFRNRYPKLKYNDISFCGGVIELKKD